MQLRDSTRVDDNDSIDDFIRARYISANEAAWRIYGFNISQQSPSVAHLSIHEEAMNHPQYHVGHLNMPPSQASTLLHYFLRPADPMFDDILYVTYATDFITSPVPRPGTGCLEGIWWHEAQALPNVPPHIV